MNFVVELNGRSIEEKEPSEHVKLQCENNVTKYQKKRFNKYLGHVHSYVKLYMDFVALYRTLRLFLPNKSI